MMLADMQMRTLLLVVGLVMVLGGLAVFSWLHSNTAPPATYTVRFVDSSLPTPTPTAIP
jgi:hypothetical protein